MMKIGGTGKWMGALCLALASMAVEAQSDATRAAVASPDEAQFSLGAGAAVSDGGYRGYNQRTRVLPLVYYQSERVSVLFTSVAYHFYKTDELTFSAVASARFDGYEAKDSPYLAGMKERRAGLDVGLQAEWGDLQLEVLRDASNASKGTEASIGYMPGFDLGSLQIKLAARVTWQNSRLANYYYGVRPSEQAGLVVDGNAFQRLAYEPGSAVIPSLSVLALYNFADRWTLLGGAEIARLPGAIKDSPIVHSSQRWGGFAGLGYRF